MPLLVSSPSLGLSDGHYHLRICTPTRPFAEHPRPSRRQVGGGRCRDQATMWLPQPRVPSNPASISWDLRRGRSPRRPLPPRPAGGSFLGAPHPVAPLSCREVVGHDQTKNARQAVTCHRQEKDERLKVVWLATSRNAYGPSRSTGLVSQRRLPPNQYQPRRPLLG